MIYTPQQLKDFVRPIIATAVKSDGDPDENIEAATNAIINFINQEREAYDGAAK